MAEGWNGLQMQQKSTFFSKKGAKYIHNPLLTSTNYYPYGMLLPERNGNSGEYRFSFQGQESDPEIKGEGNSINYKYRMHDPRIGRFFAVDPLASGYAQLSPYSFSGNIVINAIELEGLEPVVVSGKIIGYLVKEGQGPSQIAADINNPQTQKDYDYSLNSSVTYLDIVKQNLNYFKNVENISDPNDMGYRHLNMNEGDLLILPTTAIKEVMKGFSKYINGVIPDLTDWLSQKVPANTADKEDPEFRDGSSHGQDPAGGTPPEYYLDDTPHWWTEYKSPLGTETSLKKYKGTSDDGMKLLQYIKQVSGETNKGWTFSIHEEVRNASTGEVLYWEKYEDGQHTSGGNSSYKYGVTYEEEK